MYFNGFYGYGYFTYILYMLPVFLLGLWAQFRVKSAYNKYSKVPNSRGLTGAAAAQLILNHYGISDVRIQPIGGKLTDNFNPKTKIISLSEGVYNSTSVAAVGIACHEAGHAAQHAEDYAPVKLRSALVGVTNIGSRLGLIIAFAGMFLAALTALDILGETMIYIGLALYALVAVFQLVTLPVEFNASRRALKVIESDNILFDESERKGAKKVLSAAALTYVAALATALANLLYYATILLGNRRK